MTEERRWGKHIKNAESLDRDLYQKGYEEELAKVLSKYCSDDPQIFT